MTSGLIDSLLDTDYYKFTMQQVVFKKFPDVEVEYTFKNRTKNIHLPFKKYGDELYDQFQALRKLRFKKPELSFMKSQGLFSRGYSEYLKLFRFNDDIDLYPDSNGDVAIKIRGTCLNTILFETPVLATISETYCKWNSVPANQAAGRIRLHRKLDKFNKDCRTIGDWIPYVDFGARRRFSFEHQDYVVSTCKKMTPQSFVGTSNVLFAMRYGFNPKGTMAHEFVEMMQALIRLIDSQKYAFQIWADVYEGDLGIAITDTLGMDAFLKDLNLYFAKLFDGGRQDSGDPIEWGNKLISHYHSLRIDPWTKQAIFSDGLTFDKIVEIYRALGNQIKCSFGIGTNLTNDCGITPLQIVIKMTRCNGQPVAKIADSPGKQMCEDPEYLKYLASVFKIERR